MGNGQGSAQAVEPQPPQNRQLDVKRILNRFASMPEAKFLIVGVRDADKWPDGICKCKQIIIWPVTDYETKNKTDIPADVAFVFVGKDATHNTSDKIRHWIEGKDIYLQVQVTPGQTKKLLFQVINAIKAQAEGNGQMPEPDASQGSERGRLQKLVAENADINAEDRQAEITRLLEMAEEAGIKTTKGSVASTLNTFKRRQLEAQSATAPPQDEPSDSPPAKDQSGETTHGPAEQLIELIGQMEAGTINLALVLDENKQLRATLTERDTTIAKQAKEIERLVKIEGTFYRIAEEVEAELKS